MPGAGVVRGLAVYTVSLSPSWVSPLTRVVVGAEQGVPSMVAGYSGVAPTPPPHESVSTGSSGHPPLHGPPRCSEECCPVKRSDLTEVVRNSTLKAASCC